jgi:hypothetical protein
MKILWSLPLMTGFLFLQIVFHLFSSNLFFIIFYSLGEKDVEDLQHTDNDESISRQNSNHSKRNAKLSPKHRVSFRKNHSPTPTGLAVELAEDDDK